ncbi:Thiamine-binding periplasmic protein precursor [Providencia stuartii]|nr:Thiamine-binding periplasmic protein precursor [Providencia stuartii]
MSYSIVSSHGKLFTKTLEPAHPGLGLMLWIEKLYGDKSADAWQKIANKTLTVTKGWSESYGLFLKGEGDFVLSYTSSPGYQILNDNKE